MLENGKISVRQFKILVIIYTIGSSIIAVQSGMAAEAKQDAWIASILGVAVGLFLVTLYFTLGKRFPHMNLSELSEEILGKGLGKIVSLLYFSYFYILSAFLLRRIGDFITIQVMPDTPIEVVHILFMIIVIMGARLGLETFTRAAEIFLPWIIVLFFFTIIFLFPEIDIKNIQPVLGEGTKPIVRAAFTFLGIPFLELIVFLMIIPYVNQTKGVKKAFLMGTLIGSAFIIIITTMSILVIGADFTARHIYPSYVLAKKISIGNFLERVEAIIAGIWFITIFFKLLISFYASTLGLAETLNLKDYRFLTLPLGMILLALAIVISPNTVYFSAMVSKTWTPYSLTYGLFLPLLLLVVAMLRKKGSNGKAEKNSSSNQ